MKVPTFVLAALALASTSGPNQTVTTHFFSGESQPNQTSGLFCSNGYVYRSSGEQVKYAVDGKAASFGSNTSCAQAIGRRD